MNRREFIAGLGAAAGWPDLLRAQQQTKPVIAWLDARPGGLLPEPVEWFRRDLAEVGFSEGRDVTVEYHLSDGHDERLPALAADLVRRRPATAAVQRETRTIPIVFASVFDPVASGLVARLDRPSGNITGFGGFETSLGGKWLELLSEIAPGLKRAAIMFNPDTTPVSSYMPSFEMAARSLKVEAITAPVHDDVEIETAIFALGREPGGGLVVMPDIFTLAHRAPIISAATRSKVPAVYWRSDFAKDGGLLSYGADPVDVFRRTSSYVDRILRGEKPGDLPVQFADKFEMAINLPTARALGLTVPANLLALADEVIE